MIPLPLIVNTAWLPMDPVPCSVNPDQWADGLVYGSSPVLYENAVNACIRRCPVRDECLAQAMEEEGDYARSHRFGIRGGLTPTERYALFKGYTVSRKRIRRTFAKKHLAKSTPVESQDISDD